MQVVLKNPEAQRIVREQVDAGHFESEQAVVEAAILHMHDMLADTLDPGTKAALADAMASYDRGEWKDWEIAKAELKKKYNLG
jgi:Arc/MetJ-type ribon-helix-helix transcriptional regulator